MLAPVLGTIIMSSAGTTGGYSGGTTGGLPGGVIFATSASLLNVKSSADVNNLETFNPTNTFSVGFNAFAVASVYNIFLLFKYSVSPTFTAFNFSKSSLLICFQSLLLSSTNPKFLSR